MNRGVRRWNRTVLIVVSAMMVAIAAGSVLFAQQGPNRNRDPKARIERRVTMMTERLELTAEQNAKLRTILTKESDRLSALRKRGADARKSKAAEAIRTETDKEIETLLSAKQKAEYTEFKKEMEARRKERRNDRGWDGNRGR